MCITPELHSSALDLPHLASSMQLALHNRDVFRSIFKSEVSEFRIRMNLTDFSQNFKIRMNPNGPDFLKMNFPNSGRGCRILPMFLGHIKFSSLTSVFLFLLPPKLTVSFRFLAKTFPPSLHSLPQKVRLSCQ